MMSFILKAVTESLNSPRSPVNYSLACTAVCVSCGTWCFLYKCLRRRLRQKNAEWSCRCVTLTHALVISSMCIWSFWGDGKWPFSEAQHGNPNSWREQVVAVVCLGYFLFDVSWCLFHRTEGPLMLCHHICSVIGLCASLFGGRWGCELLTVTLLTEISNPFLQARWLLRQGGLDGLSEPARDQLIRACELAFVAAFGVCRLGLGTPLIVRYMRNPRTDYLGRTGALVMYGISWGFWFNICALGMRTLRGGKRRSVRNGHQNGTPRVGAKKEE